MTFILILIACSSFVLAQRCNQELEPNNNPQAATAFAGMGCIVGTLEDPDQDFFVWTVTNNDFSSRRVVFEVDAKGTELVSLQLIKPSFAENGTDVIATEELFEFEASGKVNATLPQILSAGKYYLGVVGKGSYVVNIYQAGPEFPRVFDNEPNDSSEEAGEVTGAFALSGNLQGSVDYHLWTLTEEDANKLWKVNAQAQIGKELTVKLFDSNGESVFSESVDENERLDFYDLDLTAGAYTFVLSPASEENLGYMLRTVSQGIKVEGQEVEPNDNEEQANALDIQKGVSGLLSQGERDDYRFRIAEAGFYKVDMGLEGSGQVRFWNANNVEFFQLAGERLDLGNLYFQAGEYYLRLESAQEDTPYEISFAEGESVESDYEVEPNNVQAYATPLDASLQIRGEMKGNDPDFVSFEVDSPQVFRIQVLGENLSGLAIYDSAGREIQNLGIASEQRISRLDNLVLLPDKHYLKIAGQDARYALRIISLGPAVSEALEASEGDIESKVEDAEEESVEATIQTQTKPEDNEDRPAEVETQAPQPQPEEDITRKYPRPAGILEGEPNGDKTRAMPLRSNQNYVGVLSNTNDVDYYRFSLQADQYISLKVSPPEDGLISFDVSGAPRTASSEQGEPAVLERWFSAGDYYVSVWASAPSYDYYQLKLNQLDSLNLPPDSEPNDNAAQAKPLPSNLELTGKVGQHGDEDWFLLPIIDKVNKKTSDNFEVGIDRIGKDYHSFEAENPNACFTTCEDEEQCMAWSFVQPSSEEEIGKCWLKEAISNPSLSESNISGVKLAVPLRIQTDDSEGLQFHIYNLGADAWLSDPSFDPENNLWQFSVPINQQLALRIKGQRSYDLAFDYGDVLKPRKQDELELVLELDQQEIAAYWHEGQRVSATLTLKNSTKKEQEIELSTLTSDIGVAVNDLDEAITLKANQSLGIPFNLEIMSDIRDDQPILINVAASDGSNRYSVAESLQPLCQAQPVNSLPVWPLPKELLGNYNVALTNFGAKLVEGSSKDDAFLFDDFVVFWEGSARGTNGSVFIELAGEGPITLTGTILNPYTERFEQLKDFEILTSLDGENYELVYKGELETRASEQAFVFTEPVEARYAQLRFLSNQSGRCCRIGLGEWKLLSDDVPLKEINIADPKLGGHVVWSLPLIPSGSPILTERLEGGNGDQTTIGLGEGQTLFWVVGFHRNRAAQIERFEWLDHFSSKVDQRLKEIEIEISLDSPTGPWEPLATWTLERGEVANEEEIPEIAPLTLTEPIWARYIRFKASGLEPRHYNLPETLRIFEREDDDNYLSALGEWGYYSRSAIYEHLTPQNIQTISDEDESSSRETAQLLELGNSVNGTVEIAKDIDWYKITIPEGQNLLTLELSGDPTINYLYILEDAEGQEVSLETTKQGNQNLTIVAQVKAGDYFLKLEEPPRSVVFAWDGSPSTNPYRATIYSALTRFAQDVQEGREVVSLAVFDHKGPYFILPDFSGDLSEVVTGIRQYNRRHDSSNAEVSLLGVTRALGNQVGARAVLFITDAKSGGYGTTLQLWQELEEVKPRIFTFEVSQFHRGYAHDLMQNWADVNNGVYQHITTAGQLDVGFARATCHLRRPKGYRILAESSYIKPEVVQDSGDSEVDQGESPDNLGADSEENDEIPLDSQSDTEQLPKPALGKLKVVSRQLSEEEQAIQATEQATEQNANAPAVEVILDSSGSMWRKLDGRFRYVIANEVLSNLVTDTLPAEVPFALRVFGNREENTCRTDLEVPLAPLDAEGVESIVIDIEPKPYAGTPLADSIKQVTSDLAGASGPKTVILITDGEESCDGDVEAEIQALRKQDIDVILNIIGFDFEAEDKEAARERFQHWAELGGGQYFDANSAEELEISLTQAATAPPEVTFEVLNDAGEIVTTGKVDGEELELPAGNYKLRILATEPSVMDVQVLAEQTQTLEIEP